MLNTSQFLDQIPLWAAFLLTILVLLLALEGGYRLGGYFQKRWPDQDLTNVNTMVAASLAFLSISTRWP